MEDYEPASANTQFQSDLVPRLLRSLSKTQPTQQVTSQAGAEQISVTPVRWMSKQKATAIGHFTKLTNRDRASAQVGVATDDSAAPSERPPQIPHAVQTPIDTQTNDENVDSVVPGQSPEPVVPGTFTRRVQDMLSAVPSFSSIVSAGSSRPTTPTPPQTEGEDTTSLVRHPRLLDSLTLPNFENGPFEHGWQSLRSTLERLQPLYGKKPETPGAPEPSQDDVLDCLDDNNSVMMYGPLEPDDTSEVEIACSEIVSINGDGEEIRTPQPCFSPLPSESGDEVMMGSGRRSPWPHFVPLPLESIDQVLMGGGGEVSSVRGKENESEFVSGANGMAQVPPVTEPAVDQPPVKEYRVWLPSLTKISVQTMWWGFRIYLPPPVLDVLNNRQLEAAKRAAIITTALQWLMDHLPVSLLPPQMRPGVAILRYLVPYVGYMGGFIAWSWSAIRSFDKGYGVVLTATWLLPFALVPGTWEADEVPTPDTSVSS